jgi:hypothetical protein
VSDLRKEAVRTGFLSAEKFDPEDCRSGTPGILDQADINRIERLMGLRDDRLRTTVDRHEFPLMTVFRHPRKLR